MDNREQTWEKAQQGLREALVAHAKADEARRLLGAVHPDASQALLMANRELARALVTYREASTEYIEYLKGLKEDATK
jgi:hypothetical protein